MSTRSRRLQVVVCEKGTVKLGVRCQDIETKSEDYSDAFYMSSHQVVNVCN